MQEEGKPETQDAVVKERRKLPRIDRKKERMILGAVVLLVVLGFVLVAVTNR